MIYQSDKLVQITNPIRSDIGLTTESGRKALAEQIKADIDEYCQKAYDDGRRSHLGASEIGHKCSRYLWYKFRWCIEEEFSGRMQRLFNRGHREEERFIEWLKGIGGEVIQTDESGKQLRMSAVGDHFGGSCDGNVFLIRYGLSERFLVEMKTHNLKTDEKFSDGVVYAKPMHWNQMCTYGVGFGIRYAIYFTICKDNDELHVEVLELDWELGNANLQKAHSIIVSQEAPPRVSNNPSFWECKWCVAHSICHMGDASDRNCRSCKNASPGDNGSWWCTKFAGEIPKDFIPQGCDNWESITD